MKRIVSWLTACCLLSLSTLSIAQENGQRTIVVHSGKILKVDRSDPAVVVVKTEKTDLNVELAPMTFIEQNKITLAPDGDITIRGYETIRDGKTVFVATEVTSQGNVVKLRDPEFKPLWTVKSTTAEQPVAIISHTGKVKVFERSDPARVVVVTDKGEIVSELAPMTYIEENKLLLAPNDIVTVRGYETIRDGKPVFIATEVATNDKRVVKFRSATREPLWVAATATEFKPGDITDLTGAVTVVETIDTPDGRYVTIKTDSGERVIALGPGTYLEKNRYVLAPGQKVVVRGWDVPRRDRRVFLASELRLGDKVWRFRTPQGRVLWID